MKINLAQNCVARYKLNDNEESAVVLDSSGKGYHGIAVRNTNLMHTDGKIDGALEFDGLGDKVIIPVEERTKNLAEYLRDSFSMSFWCKIVLAGKPNTYNHSFLSIYTPGYSKWFDFFVDGYEPYIYCNYVIENDWLAPECYCMENTWVMLTAVFENLGENGCRGRLYLNTTLDPFWPEKTRSLMQMSDFDSITDVIIGFCDRVNSPLMGKLDDLKIFDKALSQKEIIFLYNGGNGRENLYEDVTIEEALFDVLSSNIGISDIISTKIFPNSIPQKESLPAIVYQQNSGPRVHNMAGAVGMVKAEYTIACYAESYSQAKALSEVVRKYLDGYSGTVGSIVIDVIMMTDEFDVPNFKAGTDVLKRYGKNLTFEVWYQESIT